MPNVWKTILIDFDGTLIDSMPILYSFYMRFLKKFDIEGNEAEFHALNGSTMKMALRLIIERYRLPVTVEESGHKFYKFFSEEYVQKCALFPGVHDFLTNAQCLGVRMAIVTAADLRIVETILAKNQISQFFEHIVTTEGLAYGKPHPSVYLKALEVLKTNREETLAIEDGINGIQASLGAKISTWRFRGSSFQEKENFSLFQHIPAFSSWLEMQIQISENLRAACGSL